MINSGGSGTVPAGLPQGETEGFYNMQVVITLILYNIRTHCKLFWSNNIKKININMINYDNKSIYFIIIKYICVCLYILTAILK